MALFQDLTGRVFGRLTVLERAPRVDRRIRWKCRCACGTLVTVAGERLTVTDAPTRSCGCLQRERSADAKRTHGMKGTREYRAWKGMRQRCDNPANPAYHDYGERGITICARWQSFEAFYRDMGDCPSSTHSIDRKDNDGPYAPDNCRWATRIEQQRNTRRNRLITYNGQRKTMAEWSIDTGVSSAVLSHRLGKLKWPLERALMAQPSGKSRYRKRKMP